MRSLIEFTDRMIKRNLQQRPQAPQHSVQSVDTPPSQLHGVYLSHCHNMRPRQKESYYRLIRDNNIDGLYILAAPSWGKTLPMTCYWGHTCLGIDPTLNPSDIPFGTQDQLFQQLHNLFIRPQDIRKCLILVPTVKLAAENKKGFSEHFLSILVQYITMLSRYQPTQSRQLDDIRNVIIPTSHPDSRRIQQMLRARDNQVRSLGGNQPAQGAHRDHIIKSINETDEEILETFIRHLRDYCENQLVSIITGPTKSPTPERTPVIVATYQSSEQMIISLRRPNFSLIVFDEAHKIQQMSKSDKEATEIARNVYFTIKNSDRSTRLLFMTGTNSPTAVGEFIKYLRYCFNKRIELVNVPSSKNPAIVNYIAADWLRDENKIIERLLINPRTSNNLLVIFSSRKILEFIKKASSRAPGMGDSLQTIEKMAERGSHRLPQFGTRKNTPQRHQAGVSMPDMPRDLVDRILKIPGATEIVHPLQKGAVMNGLGFILRMTESIPYYDESLKQEYEEKDFKIVEELFEKGIVKTILATDAVGIGVNINVANMYIPTIEKPDSEKGRVPIEIANLSQLLNRAGRRAFPIANIYTPAEYIPAIQEALSARMEDFGNRYVVDGGFKAYMCESIEWFKTMARIIAS